MAIRVRTLGVGPGSSADISDAVVGLNWSSRNPGGDERCTFSLKRSWFAGAPEIAQGNLVYVEDGLTRLWSGRIEENDRRVDNAELIGVTAYGLGVRLKDDQSFMQVYVDRDASHWGDMPLAEKARLAGLGRDFRSVGWTSEAGGLVCALPNSALGAQTTAGIWYVAPSGTTVAKVMYIGARTPAANFPDGAVGGYAAATLYSSDSDASAGEITTALTLNGTLQTATPAGAKRFQDIQVYSQGNARTPAAGANERYSAIAVYGNHGLTTRSIDASTPDGVWGGDVISNLISGASGITALQVDAPTTVLAHLVFDTPGTREDAIRFVNQYFGYDWGTVGPSSVLDTSTNGYFYWKAKDASTAHWSARRADCDDVELNVELAALYNQVLVAYQDPTTSGTQTVTRTASVGALSDAGLTRTAQLDGGVLTLASAQALGDAFLALTGQQSPARGSVTLSGPISHYQRGKLPPWFMRADGSNLRLPDVLPSKDALSLSSQPDRRTLFPVSRVEVDCSGQAPRVTVEVDQARDTLSVLQARLSLAAQYPTGALPAGFKFG